MTTLKDRANQATLTEAAEILGVKRDDLMNAVMQKRIPSKKKWRPICHGRRGIQRRQVLIVDLEDVEAWAFLRRRDRGKPREREIVELFKSGNTIENISQELGIEAKSVLKSLNRAGIKPGRRDRAWA